MPRDKEKQKEYNRLYRIANKEHIKEYDRLHKKLWRKTPQGKKQNTMSTWINQGVANVNDAMYDKYINTHCCDVCSKEFKNSLDRHLDHNHDTGDFRQILCRACNSRDSWIRKIEA